MTNLRTALAALLTVTLFGCVTPPGAYQLNPGIYADNYIKLLDEDASFLVHPTGEFPPAVPVNRLSAGYEPEVVDTDNMDQKTLQLREQGYVMIGYAALSSREKGEKPCDKDTMAKAELDACRFWTAFAGVNPDADPLGDPVDAAIALNAEMVVVQRNYAFSRRETQAQRVVTADGVDTVRDRGRSSASSNTDYRARSDTSGYSNTDGTHSSETLGGSVGYGMFGPTAEVNASATEGRHSEQTEYGSKTRDQSNTRSSSSEGFNNSSTSRTQHWATALVENEVDHYDYMATYWKRVKPQNMILGAFTDPLPRELWTVLGTRSARVVRSVIGDTPAFYAELWEGDILIAVNGEKVQGAKGLANALQRYAGQEAVLTIFREDDFYELPVALNLGSASTAQNSNHIQ